MRRSKSRRMITKSFAVLAATAASILLTVSASSASTTSGTPVSARQSGHLVKKTTAAMQKVRVTRLVSSTPNKKGQVMVQLANGATVPIPQATEKKVMRRAAQQAARPEDTVVGNCGSSFITLSEKPNGYPVAMRTGFTVDEPAIGYDWSAFVVGPDYFNDFESSGFLAFDSSWSGGQQSSANKPEGVYFAAVDPAGSDAVLIDGTVCISGGPTDEEFLIAQAECLNHIPATAFFTGGGWINNAVTHVNHVNITTTPNRPGDRASTATACLTAAIPGSATNGEDITGWEDAKLFRDIFAPGAVVSRCHLIANRLGGPGRSDDGGPANLVPCWQRGVNTGTPSMQTSEGQVLRAVNALAPNQAVLYRVTPEYFDAASTIPFEIVTKATIERANGTSRPLFTRVIDNFLAGDPLLNLGN